MKQHKRILSVAALALAVSAPMGAQSTDVNSLKHASYSYMFVGVQGGAQTTFTNYNNMKLITPTASLSFGGFFTPAVGARLHFNGWNNKGGYASGNMTYDYKYLTTDVDVMLNMVTLFGRNNYYPLNAYLIAGIGLDYSWDRSAILLRHNTQLFGNARVGAMADWNLHKNLSLNLELNFNFLDDRYNGKRSNTNDVQMNLQVGLAYKFGYKKRKNETVYSSSTDMIDVDDASLSYGQRLANMINADMKEWEKRRAGESLSDYNIRVNDETRAKQQEVFLRKNATKLANDCINSQEVSIAYNAGKSLLQVTFDQMPPIVLKVSRDEVSTISNPKELKFENTIYGLTEDERFEALYTEVLHTKTGKRYIYDNLDRKSVADMNIETDDFVPLDVVQQSFIQGQKLETIKDKVMAQAKRDNLITDHTHISVSAEVVNDKDATGRTVQNYKIGYNYDVEQEYIARDDFKPGKYKAEESNAAMSMLEIIKQAFDTEFKPYIKAGKQVKIKFTGSADAAPIRGKIAYDGSYGNHNGVTVYKDGRKEQVSVSKESGITENEQLAFVRALGVRNFVEKQLPALSKMKSDYQYHIEVSDKEGGEYRRIGVEFLFVDAFDK